ncbi:MAG: hypothetical protein ACXWKA_02935 [Xanthobacteraceae bacterium]
MRRNRPPKARRPARNAEPGDSADDDTLPPGLPSGDPRAWPRFGPAKNPATGPMTARQRRMLRGWAMTMAMAFQIPGWRVHGFDYDRAEQARFTAIAADVPVLAHAFCAALTAALFVPVMTALLVALFSLGDVAFAVVFAAIALTGVIVFPLALGLASRLTDAVFSLHPGPEAAGDRELYGKVCGQLTIAAVIGLAIAFGIYLFGLVSG